ncbi:MAG: SlyX family protein [Sulfuricaulis sp.]
MNERLVELEVRVAFQEQTLQELNKVVTRQQQQIDRLTQEFATLKAQFSIVAPSLVIPQDQEIPPPHY